MLALRARQQRNFLATLLLSQGVPMLLAGDELGRTQLGNNNGYCQDNELSWLHWPALDLDTENPGTGSSLYSFARTLIRLRADHPVFRRRRFFTGRPDHGRPLSRWRRAPGRHCLAHASRREMTDEDWNTGFAKSVTVFLNGDAITEPAERGERITDDSFLLLFNAAEHDLDFAIPAAGYGEHWTQELDTADSQPPPEDRPSSSQATPSRSISRSLRLLRRA